MRDQLRLLRAGAQRAAGGATNPGVTVARSDASGWAAPYPTGFSLFTELPTGLREQGKNDKLTLLSIFCELAQTLLMAVSFRLLPTLTFLLLLPGVPVWALTASDTTRPAQAQDPLPDMGIAPGLMTTPGTLPKWRRSLARPA